MATQLICKKNRTPCRFVCSTTMAVPTHNTQTKYLTSKTNISGRTFFTVVSFCIRTDLSVARPQVKTTAHTHNCYLLHRADWQWEVALSFVYLTRVSHRGNPFVSHPEKAPGRSEKQNSDKRCTFARCARRHEWSRRVRDETVQLADDDPQPFGNEPKLHA